MIKLRQGVIVEVTKDKTTFTTTTVKVKPLSVCPTNSERAVHQYAMLHNKYPTKPITVPTPDLFAACVHVLIPGIQVPTIGIVPSIYHTRMMLPFKGKHRNRWMDMQFIFLEENRGLSINAPLRKNEEDPMVGILNLNYHALTKIMHKIAKVRDEELSAKNP
jgi:hypothetical protein